MRWGTSPGVWRMVVPTATPERPKQEKIHQRYKYDRRRSSAVLRPAFPEDHKDCSDDLLRNG